MTDNDPAKIADGSQTRREDRPTSGYVGFSGGLEEFRSLSPVRKFVFAASICTMFYGALGDGGLFAFMLGLAGLIGFSIATQDAEPRRSKTPDQR